MEQARLRGTHAGQAFPSGTGELEPGGGAFLPRREQWLPGTSHHGETQVVGLSGEESHFVAEGNSSEGMLTGLG